MVINQVKEITISYHYTLIYLINLYNMELQFKEKLIEVPRTYNGLPSVTSILSVLEDPFYIRKWKESAEDPSIVEQTIDTARKRGQYVHLVAKNYYTNNELKVSEDDLIKFKNEYGLPDLTPKIIKFLNGFNKFIAQEEVMPLAVEEPIVCKKIGAAGTPDIIGYFRNKISIIDWKTSASARLTEDTLLKYFIQISAYAAMWNVARPNHLIEQLVIVPFTDARVSGLGEIEVVDSKTLIRNYFLQFLECKEKFNTLWKLHANYPNGTEILESPQVLAMLSE